jgi:hypothetical protein
MLFLLHIMPFKLIQDQLKLGQKSGSTAQIKAVTKEFGVNAFKISFSKKQKALD